MLNDFRTFILNAIARNMKRRVRLHLEEWEWRDKKIIISNPRYTIIEYNGPIYDELKRANIASRRLGLHIMRECLWLLANI